MDPKVFRVLKLCRLQFSDELLADLTRTFFPSHGFNVVQDVDRFLEGIEYACDVSIKYDPIRLMSVACAEDAKTRRVKNTRCSHVAQLRERLGSLKSLPRFARSHTAQKQVNAFQCHILVEELARLLGVRRSRLEKMYGQFCANVARFEDKVPNPNVEYSLCYEKIQSYEEYAECIGSWTPSNGGIVVFPDNWGRARICEAFPDACKNPIQELCSQLDCESPEPRQMIPRGIELGNDGALDWGEKFRTIPPGVGSGYNDSLDWREELHNPMGRVHPSGAIELGAG